MVHRETYFQNYHMFFNILFEVYDGFIGQKIMKLWRQESLPFGLGWAAYITRIRLWTFRFPCPRMIFSCTQVRIITALQLPVNESWIWIDPLDYPIFKPLQRQEKHCLLVRSLRYFREWKKKLTIFLPYVTCSEIWRYD